MALKSRKTFIQAGVIGLVVFGFLYLLKVQFSQAKDFGIIAIMIFLGFKSD